MFYLSAYSLTYIDGYTGWWIFCFCSTVCSSSSDDVIVSGQIVTKSTVTINWDGSEFSLSPNVNVDISDMDYYVQDLLLEIQVELLKHFVFLMFLF